MDNLNKQDKLKTQAVTTCLRNLYSHDGQQRTQQRPTTDTTTATTTDKIAQSPVQQESYPQGE